MAADSTFGHGAAELQEPPGVFAPRLFSARHVHPEAHVPIGNEEKVVELLHFLALGQGKSRAAHANGIDASELVEANSGREMGDILAEPAIPLNHAVISDAQELVKNRCPTEIGMISKLDVPGKQHGIRDHIGIAHRRVMTDVACSHQKIPVAQSGRARLNRRPMNGDVLANNIFGTDLDKGSHSAVECQRLRIAPNDGRATDLRCTTNAGSGQNLGMRFNMAVVTNDNIALDDHVSINVYANANLRLWRHDGCGMNDSV